MATYTIFAGANGVGKTSIYKSIYYNENKDEKRINTDEMVARIGSWKDNNLQMKSAREAVKLIKSYISEEISFNQETTLYGIPDENIERRYYASLKNLKGVLEICNEINVYDNTEIFREIIDFKDGSLIWKAKNMPLWTDNILNE